MDFQGELGEDYVLYMLEDQEEKPVVVILPKDAAEQPLPATQEVHVFKLYGNLMSVPSQHMSAC